MTYDPFERFDRASTRTVNPFADNARRARAAMKLTQKEAAQRIGLSRSQIGNLEQGLTTPSMHTFVEMCNVYNVEPNDLLGWPTRGDSE